MFFLIAGRTKCVFSWCVCLKAVKSECTAANLTFVAVTFVALMQAVLFYKEKIMRNFIRKSCNLQFFLLIGKHKCSSVRK